MIIYKYDVSTGTVAMIYDINPGSIAAVSNGIVYKDNLYFVAQDTAHGPELWVYDGTGIPKLVTDLNPEKEGSAISDLIVFNGILYLNATNGTTGYELFALHDATSIQQMSLKGSVIAAPNPTNGDATLQLSLQQGYNCNITLMDAGGRVIWNAGTRQYPTGNNEIVLPLNNKAAGIYFYHLNDEHGKTLASGRIMKQ